MALATQGLFFMIFLEGYKEYLKLTICYRVSTVGEEYDVRLWNALDSIEKRLSGIETKLENVIRLEERVNNHEQVIARFGTRLDEGDFRIRKLELWQAEHNPDLIVSSIKSNHENIESIKDQLISVKEKGNISKGHRDIGKEVLKWVAGILAAYIIWKATRGS